MRTRWLLLGLVAAALVTPTSAASAATWRVSVASDGSQANDESFVPALSAIGRYVAFESQASNLVAGDTNGGRDIYVHDRRTGQTRRVSVASDGAPGNTLSRRPALSASGRFVAFDSLASNLVAGDTNGDSDVFVHDRRTGRTGRVSVASDGAQANWSSWSPALSASGRYVAFQSFASRGVSSSLNRPPHLVVAASRL